MALIRYPINVIENLPFTIISVFQELTMLTDPDWENAAAYSQYIPLESGEMGTDGQFRYITDMDLPE